MCFLETHLDRVSFSGVAASTILTASHCHLFCALFGKTPEWLDSDSCQKCDQPFFWNFKQMWDSKKIGLRQVGNMLVSSKCHHLEIPLPCDLGRNRSCRIYSLSLLKLIPTGFSVCSDLFPVVKRYDFRILVASSETYLKIREAELSSNGTKPWNYVSDTYFSLISLLFLPS